MILPKKKSYHTGSANKNSNSLPQIVYRTPSGKKITFNSEQAGATLSIQQWLRSSSTCYTLAGYAGTGKSSIVGYIVQNLQYVVVSAPTHKAKIVIERSTGKPGATIQSLLGLQPNTNLDEFDINNVKFDTIGNKLISKYKLVVVDEASMLNEDLYTLLVNEAKKSNTKVLFMGDNAQLPPINEKESMVFSVPEISWLKKIERQSGDNPLMSIYDSIRNNINSQHDVFEHTTRTIEKIDNNTTCRQGIVFVDEDDIDRNKDHIERNKLKYVALSRPTNIAYNLYTGR